MDKEKTIYLKRLAYMGLTDMQAVAGFIKHYALEGMSLINLRFDVCLISCATAADEAAARVAKALETAVQEIEQEGQV